MSLDPALIRLSYELWEASLPGREYILSVEALDTLDRIPRAEAVEVRRALRYLNRLGHLVARGPLDADFVRTLVGKEVIRTVEKLQPALTEVRGRRGDPQYLEYVDALLRVCREAYPDYQAAYYPEERRNLGLSV